jgi:hypothetical protein
MLQCLLCIRGVAKLIDAVSIVFNCHLFENPVDMSVESVILHGDSASRKHCRCEENKLSHELHIAKCFQNKVSSSSRNLVERVKKM